MPPLTAIFLCVAYILFTIISVICHSHACCTHAYSAKENRLASPCIGPHWTVTFSPLSPPIIHPAFSSIHPDTLPYPTHFLLQTCCLPLSSGSPGGEDKGLPAVGGEAEPDTAQTWRELDAALPSEPAERFTITLVRGGCGKPHPPHTALMLPHTALMLPDSCQLQATRPS